MKLHIGCGGVYIPGAVNIDKYSLRVADIKADTLMLPVRSNTCDAVICHHVLEHLGYTGAVYALSEFYRVLKPNGVVELETPDPERSFRAFISNSEPHWRAAVLSWIFGIEESGMGHKGLLPKELFERLVTEAGFCSLEFSEPKTHRHRWGLRCIAIKGLDPTARLISLLRPCIVSQVLYGATPQEAMEIEFKIWEGLRHILGHGSSPGQGRELLLELMVIAPEIFYHWAGLSGGYDELPVLRPPLDIKVIGRVAYALLEAGLCYALRSAFSTLCATVNQVPDTYNYLLDAAKCIINNWLVSPPKRPGEDLDRDLKGIGILIRPDVGMTFSGDFEISNGTRAIAGQCVRWPDHTIFTKEHLLERVRWFRDVGIKCFSLGRLDDARRLFRIALNSKLGDLYTLWNMARLQATLGNTRNAEIFYNAALGLQIPEDLRYRIKSEIQAPLGGRTAYTGPVSVGEGQDRIMGFLGEEYSNDRRCTGGERGGQAQNREGGVPRVFAFRSDENTHSADKTRHHGPVYKSHLYPPPNTIMWELTLKCQCRCMHCAASAGRPRHDELIMEEAFKICDQIAELGIPSVCLMGGEPLLHPHWEAISRRLKGSGISLGLTTNGIGLDSKTWKKLDEIGFSQVVISLDGASAEVHDTRRRKKGAFDSALTAIKEMASRPLLARTVVTSVDRTNISDLEGIRDWLVENAPYTTWMINTSLATQGGRLRQENAVDLGGFLSVVGFIASNRAKYKSIVDITGTHGIGYFSRTFPDLFNYSWSGCEAGISKLGLRSNGFVIGCLIMSDVFIEGNVRQRTLGDIWNDPGSFLYNRGFSVDKLRGKCTLCKWGKSCKGGCRETAYSYYADPFEAPFCLYSLEKDNKLP